jgi:hypothetical protein
MPADIQPVSIQATASTDITGAQFCRWLLRRKMETRISSRVRFTQMVVVSTHNTPQQVQENPYFTRQLQVRWSLNMWVGLLGDCTIGTYCYMYEVPLVQ